MCCQCYTLVTLLGWVTTYTVHNSTLSTFYNIYSRDIYAAPGHRGYIQSPWHDSAGSAIIAERFCTCPIVRIENICIEQLHFNLTCLCSWFLQRSVYLFEKRSQLLTVSCARNKFPRKLLFLVLTINCKYCRGRLLPAGHLHSHPAQILQLYIGTKSIISIIYLQDNA